MSQDFTGARKVRQLASWYIIPATMDTLDPAGEFLQISERYRQMSDDELLVLIPQSSELTPFAQQALANEIRQRGMKAEVEVQGPSAPSPFKTLESNADSFLRARISEIPRFGW